MQKHHSTNRLAGYDWFLIGLVLLLCVLGMVFIANATADPYHTSDADGIYGILDRVNGYYPLRQLVFMALGIVLAIAINLFPMRFYSEMSMYIYIGMTLVLLATKLFGSGRSGMEGWIVITESISIQPSELCKILFIITLAKQLSNRSEPVRTVGQLLPVLGQIALPVALIVWQPDFGTAMVYLAISIGMLFLSGTSMKLLIALLLLGVSALVPLWFVIGEFRQERVLNFLDPSRDVTGTGLQVNNSKIAIGSGQWTGKGLFREGGISQLDYVPEKHTDFIFSVTAESVGFWGSLIIVGLYLLLIGYLYWKAMRTPDMYVRLIVVGVASMFLFHVFENIGMCLGVMPVTGIPLPFMSYGGSNMWANLMCVGMVLNATRKRKRTMLFARSET